VEPFLLLSIRADDAAADNEYESFRTLAGLTEAELRRIRLDRGALGDIDLRDWSGIWVGGGPFNYTDQGGVVDRRYPEDVGTVRVRLTAAGRSDPLLAELPEEFDAFTGHKEAVSELPGGAVLLASSADCPVQAFRVGANVYATQFHPELDAAGLCTRIDVYKHAGYFPPSEADELKALAWRSDVSHPPAILRAFVRLYSGSRDERLTSANR